MKIKLHNLIFVGMALGVIVGLSLYYLGKTTDDAGNKTWTTAAEHTLWWLDLLGPTIFMGALKMIIAPLILASIVAGVTSLPNMDELGTIGWKTMVYYICTTTIAVVIGLVAVLTIRPGKQSGAQRVTAKQVAQQDEIRDQY